MTERPTVIVTDIEGTTTPVTFVTEVLFPYAREHLPPYVAAHASDPDVSDLLDQTRSLNGTPGMTTDETVDLLLSWIDQDRKATPLKALQGLIWREGYRSGGFTAPLYTDVAPALSAWRSGGIRLCVYSSGSVEAQELLFRHSSAGDVTHLFEDYFDTRVGAKIESDSYDAISRILGCQPAALLFLSDTPAEIVAATQAGWRAVRIDRARDADAALTSHDAEFVAPTFAAVASWLQE